MKCMTLNEYQLEAMKTAVYPTLGHPIVYPVLGLNGEAGEVAEKVKKLFRDRNYVPGDELPAEFCRVILKELGDVLWYVSETARQAGYTLEEVATHNIEKLTSREIRGVLHGSGDER